MVNELKPLLLSKNIEDVILGLGIIMNNCEKEVNRLKYLLLLYDVYNYLEINKPENWYSNPIYAKYKYNDLDFWKEFRKIFYKEYRNFGYPFYRNELWKDSVLNYYKKRYKDDYNKYISNG